ncbi:hypothetical protein [Hyphomicrobium sulfonivorans]|uniref:hypothetical protein n=1 Tax=Hyphomicrobium sulfonivorans TaxID=121290 RepID=UPI00156F6DF0|nr:hypothetical protein [Hyphomicrobium sulfonivorans]MBI1651163.1 hypothetical protein [Hyphomicrobium sulfonivorans]NSL72453.1 hypothetical protein [Hyphomicrobium sulfonivorans]
MPKFLSKAGYAAAQVAEPIADVFAREANAAAQIRVDAETAIKAAETEIPKHVLAAHAGDAEARARIAELKVLITEHRSIAELAGLAEEQLRAKSVAALNAEAARRDRHVRRKFVKIAGERSDAAKRFAQACDDLLKARKDLLDRSVQIRAAWRSNWPSSIEGMIHPQRLDALIAHEIHAAAKRHGVTWPAAQYQRGLGADWGGLGKAITAANTYIRRALLEDNIGAHSSDGLADILDVEDAPAGEGQAEPVSATEDTAPEWDGTVPQIYPPATQTTVVAEGADIDPFTGAENV